MLYLHPITQCLATILAIYAIYSGIQRFRSAHLHAKTLFKWKRHVWIGILVMVLWPLGFAGGFIITRNFWYTNFITGAHANIGVVMCPMIVVGLLSGIYMNRVKKKRTVLPLIHGVNNALLFLLALFQVYSGWQVLQRLVVGAT